MSLKRDFLVAFCASLFLGSLVAWIYLNPPASEQFASISILGPLNTAGPYFPNNNSVVTVGNETIPWTIQVYNHLGSSQLFQVKVLLANRTIPGPDPSTNTPTNGTLAPVIFQEYHGVLDNDNWTIPMQWSISNRTVSGSTVTIHSMIVNGQNVSNVEVSAPTSDPNTSNFRLVIELRTYYIPTQGFLFSYLSDRQHSVFNQIWFTVH